MNTNFTTVEQKLRKLYAKERRNDLLFLSILGISFLLLAFAAVFLLDWMTGFPAALRIAFTIAIPAALLYLFLRKLRSRTERTDLCAIARLVEQKSLSRRTGGFQALLISASEIAAGNGHGSGELQEKVLSDALLPDFDPSGVVLHDTRIQKYAFRFFCAAAAFYLLWLLIGPASLGVFFGRCLGLSWRYPTRTRILSVEAPKFTPRFENVTLRVKADGVLPAGGQILAKFENGEELEIPLERTADNSGDYTATMNKASESFDWNVRLGDAESTPGHVSVVKPPDIAEGTFDIQPPDYAKQPNFTRPFGSFEALEGSSFRFRMKPDRAVKTCEMLCSGLTIPGKWNSQTGEFVFPRFNLTRSQTFTMRLSDANGIENRDRVEYAITAVKDMPPSVTLETPENGLFYSSKSKVRYALKATDDIGLQSVALRFTPLRKVTRGDEVNVVRGKTKILQLKELDFGKDAAPEGYLNLAEIDIADGESAELQFIVCDGKPKRGSTEHGMSDTVVINKVSPAELRRIIDEEAMQVHQILSDVRTDMKDQRKRLKEIMRKGNAK